MNFFNYRRLWCFILAFCFGPLSSQANCISKVLDKISISNDAPIISCIQFMSGEEELVGVLRDYKDAGADKKLIAFEVHKLKGVLDVEELPALSITSLSDELLKTKMRNVVSWMHKEDLNKDGIEEVIFAVRGAGDKVAQLFLSLDFKKNKIRSVIPKIGSGELKTIMMSKSSKGFMTLDLKGMNDESKVPFSSLKYVEVKSTGEVLEIDLD